MAYTVNYGAIATREARDMAALDDIMQWLGEERAWAIFAAARECRTHDDVAEMNFAMALCGVSYYPFHAAMRHCCLPAYIEWLTTGPNALRPEEVDAAGFIIKT